MASHDDDMTMEAVDDPEQSKGRSIEEMAKESSESLEQLQREKQELQDRIRDQENEIQALKEEVARLTRDDNQTDKSMRSKDYDTGKETLSAEQIERYSRQLLLNDGFGVQGQLKLLSSSVLVIGAGGIGSAGAFQNYD